MENPNEKTNPEREFEICTEYRLTRVAKVSTDNYNDSIDEDGCRGIDASGNDWRKEYEGKYMTPLEIMEAVKEFMPALSAYYFGSWSKLCIDNKKEAIEAYEKLCKIQDIERSIDGWEETFEEAYEV